MFSHAAVASLNNLEMMVYHYVIKNRDKVMYMTIRELAEAAANALLKTLEEPPENTWFFLACEEPARLLTTLRSRCRLHHLAPPSEPYALAWLEREVSLPQESLLTALRLCASAPAAALELLQEPLWTARQQRQPVTARQGSRQRLTQLLPRRPQRFL